MPTLVTYTRGSTNPSTRLPATLLGRFRAGDTVAQLADDYGIPDEQVDWGLELAAWREVAEKLPTVRQRKAIVAIEGILFRLHRTYAVIFNRREMQAEEWHSPETLEQIAADREELRKRIEGAGKESKCE